MERYAELLRVMKEEYGISTMAELDKAIANLGTLDITMFCGREEFEVRGMPYEEKNTEETCESDVDVSDDRCCSASVAGPLLSKDRADHTGAGIAAGRSDTEPLKRGRRGRPRKQRTETGVSDAEGFRPA